MPSRYAQLLAESAPGFAKAADTARVLQAQVVRRVVISPEVPRAVRLISVLAVSDITDLLDEVERGSGRAAMRSARTLIEHAVNVHTVIRSEDSAERYLAHLEQGAILLADAPGAVLLDLGPRRSAIHAARKAAASARPKWDAALAKYGSGFQRQWHPSPLRDRAVASGREDFYDLYRLGSAVTHGSAAGAIGQYNLHESDVATYAAGRVPALVPLAFAIGVSAYLQLLVHVEDNYPGVDLDMAGSAVKRALLDHQNGIWRAVDQLSRDSTMRGETSAYLAFSARGRVRWYLHSSELGPRWYRLVEDPYLDDLAEWLLPVRRAYVERDGEFTEGGWAAIEVGPVPVHPDWSKRPIPDSTMPIVVRDADGRWIAGRVVGERVVAGAAFIHDRLGEPPGLEN